MGAANAWSVIKRVLRVTARTMCREVELRNEEFQCKPVLGKLEFFGIALYPLMKLYGPTACDIIGNLDDLDVFVFHSGQENVIHVHEPYTSR